MPLQCQPDDNRAKVRSVLGTLIEDLTQRSEQQSGDDERPSLSFSVVDLNRIAKWLGIVLYFTVLTFVHYIAEELNVSKITFI